MSESRPGRPVSRRRFLAGVGGLGAIAGSFSLTDWELNAPPAAAQEGDSSEAVAFEGIHQAGVTTRAQDYLHFAAFDLVTDDRRDVAQLLQEWSAAASRLCAGKPVAALDDNLLSPPGDTGETLGLGANQLTVTFGFGAGLFEADGTDRYGLASKRPTGLVDIPPFPGDQLDPSRVGGDLGVQACADDPVVAFHAIHNLGRIAQGIAVQRWSQLGFGRTSATSRSQETPRNLMGFKDGTNNIRNDDTNELVDQVWVGNEGPEWMKDGTFLVARRIRILLEAWDRSSLDEQQRTIGRHKQSGAPLGGIHEFDPVDLGALDPTGQPLIPLNAHIRLASPAENAGTRILRRGYSFNDGVDELGQLDAGLFFICYQRDVAQFIRLQHALSQGDALNKYVRHTGSATFACPPGATRGWVGESLLA